MKLNSRVIRNAVGADYPPVLVMHGLLGSGRNWRTIGKRLSDSRDVHLLDLRNHGKTMPHMDSMTMEEMVEDVRAYTVDQGIQECSIVGHSMGGKVACVMAKFHPSLVRSLVAVDVAPVSYESNDEFVTILGAMKKLTSSSSGMDQQERAPKSLRECDTRLAAAGIADARIRAFVLTNLSRDMKSWQVPVQSLLDNLHHVRGFDVPQFDEAPAFNRPTLFVYGGDSNYVRTSHHAAIKQHFPQVQFECIANAGHWVHAEKPKPFVECVSSFLEKF